MQRFTRGHDDVCDMERRAQASTGPGRYVATNLMPPKGATKPIANANLTFNVQPRGYGGPDREAVDVESALRTDKVREGRAGLPLHTQSRPIATVPFMGRGRGNAQVESSLLHSNWARMDRSCGTVTEKPFEGAFTPLVPHLAAHVQNPKNLMTEEAAPGWIRGGLSSRAYMRDLQC